MDTELIDWFTVVAQIINFLVLVYLLWRFLYKPITRVMDERQHRMAARWQEARDKQKQAEQEAAKYRHQQQELEERRSRLMEQAKDQADAKRRELIQQARQEVDELREQWRASLQRRQAGFLANLRQQVADRTTDLTRRILQDVVNASLEQQAIRVFKERLQQLDDGDRETMGQAIRAAQEPVVIRSGFPIPQEARQPLIQEVQQQLADGRELVILPDPELEADPQRNGDRPPHSETPAPHPSDLADYQTGVRFITAPQLICGIALQAAGQEVGWSIRHYLRDVENQFAALIQEEINRGERPVSSDKQAGDRTLDQLQHQLFHQTCAIARHALQDLADADLEERTIAVFLRRLESTRPADYGLEQPTDQPVTLRSSFEIPPNKRHQIVHQLRDRGFLPQNAAEDQIRFTTTDDLICGIELQMGDRTLSWSLDDYLRSLERSLETHRPQSKI
ncbi:MAG: hypothetical protein ACFB8W_14650 [Elainellaceae cyanobacterium]